MLHYHIVGHIVGYIHTLQVAYPLDNVVVYQKDIRGLLS